MKKCPYCAEEIQDEAIKCRYCHSDLTVAPATHATGTGVPSDSTAATGVPSAAESSPPPTSQPAPETTAGAAPAPTGMPAGTPTPAPTATSADAGSVRYTHSGYRYVLGYGDDFFGIWDRQAPAAPAERFPRTDEGWRQAWTRFAGLEPRHVAVPPEGGGAQPQTGASEHSGEDDVLQYTHSGTRYLLGYGRSFFGIWDRQAPATPVEKFARDDAGWAAAWRRFTQIEHNFTEVGLGSGQDAGAH